MKRRVCATTALALSLVAGPVLGAAAPKAPACYSRTEHAAEQLLRLHTEIMTVGLYCKEINAADDPFGMYQRFTVANRIVLSDAEKTLMAFYTKNGGKAKFDTFRTELANEASRRSAIINVGVYCHEYVEHLKELVAVNTDQLKTVTTDETKGGLMHLSSRPLCEVKVVSLPDPPPSAVAAKPPAKAPAKKTATAKPAAPSPAAPSPKPDAKPAAKPAPKAGPKPVKTASAN